MCGFYGLVNQKGNIQQEYLVKQASIISHRGPDDAGDWISKNGKIGLAHRRLSIIDLSPTGHQPMASPDGRCVIVFNGEVYNFQEIRKELKKASFRFKGESDTEVVLAAYQAWGDQCVTRFNGMFAFTIYDEGDRGQSPSLFMARDRAGEKPFYYSLQDDKFQFSSELKAIQGSKEIDLFALNYYLALGYVPRDLCLFKGNKKLPPAHAARLELDTLKLKIWEYWSLPRNQPDLQLSGDTLADKVESLLMDSVKLRLISDVPVGVLLSGGMDSSLIVAAASKQSSKPVKTFTISFPGTRYDESPHARSVSDYFSTEHHVLEANESALNLIDEISTFIDEPIADSSLIPTFLVSKLTRESVKVALGGDGGDELFGGYSHYVTALVDQKGLGWVPSSLLKALGKMAGRLPAGMKGRNRLSSLKNGPLQQMVWGSPYFDIGLRKRIFKKELLNNLGEEIESPERLRLKFFLEGDRPVDKMTRSDYQTTFPDDYLVKIDRASMYNSLELRSPFLDYRLVEIAFGAIPDDWKVLGKETRRIQRILAKRLLPPDLNLNRKQGFSFPLDELLRDDKCEMIRKNVRLLTEYLNLEEIESLISGHLGGRANGARLYSLLMLGIGMQNNKSI